MGRVNPQKKTVQSASAGCLCVKREPSVYLGVQQTLHDVQETSWQIAACWSGSNIANAEKP